MVKLVVLYGAPQDPAAFEEHYANTHVPLATKVPNLARFEAGPVLATPDGSELPYHWMAELWFEDIATLQASLGSPEGQAAAGDVRNFASGGASMFIADVG